MQASLMGLPGGAPDGRGWGPAPWADHFSWVGLTDDDAKLAVSGDWRPTRPEVL